MVKFWPGDRNDPFHSGPGIQEVELEPEEKKALRDLVINFSSQIEAAVRGRKTCYSEEVAANVNNIDDVVR